MQKFMNKSSFISDTERELINTSLLFYRVGEKRGEDGVSTRGCRGRAAFFFSSFFNVTVKKKKKHKTLSAFSVSSF